MAEVVDRVALLPNGEPRPEARLLRRLLVNVHQHVLEIGLLAPDAVHAHAAGDVADLHVVEFGPRSDAAPGVLKAAQMAAGLSAADHPRVAFIAQQGLQWSSWHEHGVIVPCCSCWTRRKRK